MVLTRCIKKKIHLILQEIENKPNFKQMDFFSISVNGHAVDEHTETYLLHSDVGMEYVKEIERYLKVHSSLSNKLLLMKWDLMPLSDSINNVYLNCFKC